ncbi:MAG: hypothetical protein A2216_02950 [Omnitrophica WOR_2 bacterium RIFOXYA2_FULL_45_12]|nr:MAG: hypothetical protein A2216_02950 [Omnitrophica WOR_2 bacterium RIFOXYA2_FULL_45_12]
MPLCKEGGRSLKSGILSLHPLYEFLELDHDKAGLYGKSSKGRNYGKVVDEICRIIVATQGFYLWGRYERNGLWRNIYLGKAGFGRTAHLRARIKEELKDERACIWRAFVSVRTMEVAGERNYPRMWHQYKKHMHRALKKTGAAHIVWVTDPQLANSQVQNIESDLIETLSPSANMSRPVPPVTLQEHTKTIIGEFRKLIHAHRLERFLADRRDFLIPPTLR